MLKNAIIDLSHHNTVPSLQQVKKAGVLAVFHKATQGTGFRDEDFIDRRRRCKIAKLLFGAYHFGDNSPVDKQVDHFLKFAGSDPDSVLILDWEGNGDDTMSLAQAEKFVEQIHAKAGKWPILYSGMSFLATKLYRVNCTILTHCPLWLARYNSKPPNVPKPFKRWDIWQYTSEGKISGVSGDVDVNHFNGTPEELKALWDLQ